VYLSQNEIADLGAIALAEAIGMNKSLTAVYAFGNHITDTGANALAEAMKYVCLHV
jgi:hypothetical protein